MTTLRELAGQHQMQVHELAAYLDLGRDYDETADLDESTEAEYRAALAVDAPDAHADLVEQLVADDAIARIAAAKDLEASAVQELHDAIRSGAVVGIGERRLAEAAGLARATVRKIIGR